MAKRKVTVGDLSAAMEELAPLHLAETWDNVGLIAGDVADGVKRVLLAIDLTPAVFDEAVRMRAEAVVVYHPPVFKAMKTMRSGGKDATQLAVGLVRKGVAIYSPHTALDVAEGGTNDALAKVVGLEVTGSFVQAAGNDEHAKLVVFVPEEHVEGVSEAMFAAGAGRIGAKAKYERCSFRVKGVGTFQGGEDANPAVGKAGVFERVPEVRLETILPKKKAGAVMAALLKAHPYEEVACDLVPLMARPETVGLGRYARVAGKETLGGLAGKVKRALGVEAVQVVGDLGRRVKKVGIVAGSGGRMGLEVATEQVDVFLTGEMKHHDMLAYGAAGVGVICVGHGESERPVLGVVRKFLVKHLAGVDVRISKSEGVVARVL